MMEFSNRIHTSTAPHFSSAAAATTQYFYNSANRPTLTLYPDSSASNRQYAVGQLTTRDPSGATLGYDVDPFGRVTAVRENRRNCAGDNCPIVETATTQYRYDALDRLIGIVDAQKHQTLQTWDSLGRILSVADPDRGLMQFEWNDDDTLASRTDANKSVVKVGYDFDRPPESGKQLQFDGNKDA